MDTTNEPVAWMSQGGDVTRSKDYFVEMGFTNLIPLYTHPAELTDEEILDTFDPHFDADIGDKELIKFARAILRKASEK